MFVLLDDVAAVVVPTHPPTHPPNYSSLLPLACDLLRHLQSHQCILAEHAGPVGVAAPDAVLLELPGVNLVGVERS
jgi:hypothetical protein